MLLAEMTMEELREFAGQVNQDVERELNALFLQTYGHRPSRRFYTLQTTPFNNEGEFIMQTLTQPQRDFHEVFEARAEENDLENLMGNLMRQGNQDFAGIGQLMNMFRGMDEALRPRQEENHRANLTRLQEEINQGARIQVALRSTKNAPMDGQLKKVAIELRIQNLADLPPAMRERIFTDPMRF